MAKTFLVTVEVDNKYVYEKLAHDCESENEAAREVLEGQCHGDPEWVSDYLVNDFGGEISIEAKSVTEVTGNDKIILSRYL